MTKTLKTNRFDKEGLLIVLGAGAFFGLVALFREFSIKAFFIGFLFGVYSGFVALPFIDSEKWTAKPELYCILGIVGGVFFGFLLNTSFEHIILFGIVGGILGYFAPVWVRHI